MRNVFHGPAALAEADVVLQAVNVTVWGRWLVLLVVVFLLAYRPGFWYPDQVAHIFLQAPLVVFNGLVHYRLLTRRPVTWRWMLALGILDIALITANVAVRGDFDSLVFVAYYPALAAFSLVFTSTWLGLVWATAAALSYAGVSTLAGPGLDLDAGEEKALVARVAAMYVMVLCISLVVRFERTARQAALARERQAQRERIDISQEIHDTTAQTVYMIRLGIDVAMSLAGRSHPQLAERLAATSALSKSALWELRRPIDMGDIVEGKELRRVLGSHTETFAQVTSVPAEFVLSGDEPPLTQETKSGLFSIAHNALANAFLHAQADRVEVRLDFDDGRIRLSVSDDGVGLPADYAERGRGFRGMQAVAERLGGVLEVQTTAPGEGTTVSCVVPCRPDGRGD
ncbi:MAG: histidine kinase [Chloroflexota bacterium]|nr:histidine kinase [Chloroflexota bacterium]MDE2883888.1 histidine kinase [Chloroflexota bacterium]